MQNRAVHILLLFCLVAGLHSCVSSKKFTARYYRQNEQTLNTIEQSYKVLNTQQPFSIEFTDKSFNYISLEILTDTLKYIYEFGITEKRLQDTLAKYHMNAPGITALIQQMRSIRCIWVNKLDYYANDQKKSMVFMSIRPVALELPFTYQKYYILTFFQQPQYFDQDGKLLAGRRLRKLRKINDEEFRRINDRVCYTLSERFR
ncbi:MAG: hypothetical protein NVSMB63_08100 [Sediminibacterium sp.]